MAACIAAPKGGAGHKDPTARAKDKEQRPSHSDSDSVVSHKGRAGHKDRVAELERAPPAAPEFWQRQGLVKVLLMELGCYRVQPSSISSTLKIWEYKYLLSNVHRIVRMLFVLFAVKLAR